MANATDESGRPFGWLHDLRDGDIIRNAGSGTTYVVVLRSDGRSAPVVARTIAAMNPSEWIKIDKATGQPDRRG